MNGLSVVFNGIVVLYQYVLCFLPPSCQCSYSRKHYPGIWDRTLLLCCRNIDFYFYFYVTTNLDVPVLASRRY